MLKGKKKDPLDQPVTQRHLLAITDTMREIADFIMKEMRDFRKEFEDFRFEQGEFNKKISQEVQDLSKEVKINTESIVALDARVIIQDDLPGKVGLLSHQQNDLALRVTALERQK